MDPDFDQMLRAYRSGRICLTEMRGWLTKESDRVERQLSRGLLLRLKHGNDSLAMAAIARLLPACAHCAALYEPKEFATRDEHRLCSRRCDLAVAARTLVCVAAPEWGGEVPPSSGSAKHYRCATCESIWVLVDPEREDNGSWSRIA